MLKRSRESKCRLESLTQCGGVASKFGYHRYRILLEYDTILNFQDYSLSDGGVSKGNRW